MGDASHGHQTNHTTDSETLDLSFLLWQKMLNSSHSLSQEACLGRIGGLRGVGDNLPNFNALAENAWRSQASRLQSCSGSHP